MVFMKKKRVKFAVELEVLRLTDVPLLNAILFAKVRLIDGGNFEEHTKRGQVTNFSVPIESKFEFICRVPADVQTGELEICNCKISVRKEDRGGRTATKLGYVIVNLSEFAASRANGITRSYLLDGYSGKNRQDNSRIHIRVRMTPQGTDPLFKVPFSVGSSIEEAQLNPADRKAPASTPITSRLDDINGETAPTLLGDIEEKPVPILPTPSSSAAIPISQSYMDRASWHGQGTTPIESNSVTNMVERRLLGTSATSLIHATRRMSDDRINATLNRVQRTRRDAEGVIEEVLAEATLEPHAPEERKGLALIISKDGEPVIGQTTLNSTTDTYEKTLGDSTIN